ncbi:MAG: glycosyltransferase family 2 protein, partial [Bacteroidales bacterium]|nr:glycosyltransferase family 2 protein [Bacteroidales bacterium]
MDDIALSIFVFSCNHAQFVEKCIRSVLEQKCTYNYKIYVFDDCSTDGTAEIVKKLAVENPGSISFYENEKNMGVLHSVRKAIGLPCKAKYFAFLDGDDYWCYDGKLQAQIDFLEANPEYSACFHDAEIHQMNNSGNVEFLKKTKIGWKTYSQMNKYYPDFEPQMLVTRTIIPTSTLVCRWKNLESFMHNYRFKEFSFSWALELELIKNSKFRYFNECWSVYNDHVGGISKRGCLFDFKRNNINILESLLDDDFYRFYAPEIYQTICSEFRMMIKSDEGLRLSKREYRKLLSEYRGYQRKEIKVEKRQFLHD